MVNEAGPNIKAILSTSASEPVRRRCYESGMNVFWWNPLYDDISDPNSISRRLVHENGAPCMNAGGNVGTSATVFAARILQASRVIMLGMDFSYYDDTPIESTQYYDQFKKFMLDAEIPHAFKTIVNPYLGKAFFTDPAYYWYREAFLDLLPNFNGCEIINATEGGILFGDDIIWMSVNEILEQERTKI